MSSDAALPSRPPVAAPVIHPLWLRATHWLNAIAIFILVTSGWQIYNASPLFPFSFPDAITLGEWLGGALLWHFAAMWLLVVNGLVYLARGTLSGRLRQKLLPVRVTDVKHDLSAALRGKLEHADPTHYNALQKLAYIVAIVAIVAVVLSGLAIWKPVQLQVITEALGGYESARIVHFLAMATIVLFVVGHVAMALLVPRTILAMIRGR